MTVHSVWDAAAAIHDRTMAPALGDVHRQTLALDLPDGSCRYETTRGW